MEPMHQDVDTACGFCAELHGIEDDNNLMYRLIFPKTGLKSRILYNTDHVAVMPTVGSFVEGYLLLVSRRHVSCIGDLQDHELAELEGQLAYIKRQEELCYHKRVACFEHGMAACSRRSGGCIDHAHLHVVPCEVLLEDFIKKYDLKYRRIASMKELQSLAAAHKPYLFWEEIDGTKWVIDEGVIPSQFFRKVLADIHGVNQQWDWRQHYCLNNMVKTLQTMTEKRQRSKSMDEKIVVVSSEIMGRAYGVDSEKIIQVNETELLDIVHRNYELVLRSKAEQDSTYKQMISYCLITCGGEIFVTRRTKKQTESRLHNMYSVGIGGHISATDLGSEDVVITGMLRELHEEVFIPSDVDYEFFGIINDNSTEVNSVHLGICYIIRLDEKNCSVRETEKMEGKWIRLDEIPEYLEHMEGWSKILLGSYLAEQNK